jgi:predicted  nucleic acid-binding Zn-ribbon protein
MAKIFETSADIAELAQDKFEDTGLAQMGIDLKVLSVTKSKSVLKVSRANATTHYLTNKDVILLVYEEAFDRLSDEFKNKLMEGAISNISYDSEKDKLNVEGDVAKEMFRMRRKHDNYVDVMETAYLVIQQIEDEEKQRKEEEKLKAKVKDLEAKIEPRLLTSFKRIRKNARNGLGIVYVQRDACGGCFNKIPPQRQLDIKMHKKVIVCEYCGRILIDPELAGVKIDKVQSVEEKKTRKRAIRKTVKKAEDTPDVPEAEA